jgi:hypothetical protein
LEESFVDRIGWPWVADFFISLGNEPEIIDLIARKRHAAFAGVGGGVGQ